jgi:hypothetical protein
METQRESFRKSLVNYSNIGQKTAYAFGYLQSACSSMQYTREEIRDLSDMINYELSIAR